MKTGKWKGECAAIFRSIFEPTCIYSQPYTVLKISSISYPYQCLFVPSAPKGMGREKISIYKAVLLQSEVESFDHVKCDGSSGTLVPN